MPSLTFTDYEWFPWSISNGCGMPAGNTYPSGHLVPSLIVVLACAPFVETRFLELAMSLLDFSPRIPLGTFSILLHICVFYLPHPSYQHLPLTVVKDPPRPCYAPGVMVFSSSGKYLWNEYQSVCTKGWKSFYMFTLILCARIVFSQSQSLKWLSWFFFWKSNAMHSKW